MFKLLFRPSLVVNAEVLSTDIEGRIVSFDQKTITIEFSDQKIKFDRKQIGIENARVGDVIYLTVKNNRVLETGKKK